MNFLKHTILYVAATLILFNASVAQSYTDRLQTIDVQHYTLSFYLNDESDVIQAIADIEINFLKPTEQFTLDLSSVDSEGKGMSVSSVSVDGNDLRFEHKNDILTLHSSAEANSSSIYTIEYSGVPKTGLIISTNKFGDRTFFGDNWPNRAHNWIPSVDHPSDKAFFTFIVDAPDHYQVVANGVLKEEININDDITRYKWETTVPLPTKVAVIGVARFAVQNVKKIHDIEVSTWVYPQNADEGFYDYEPAASILDFFIDFVGPYPYQKLANVQSKTQFGGMENASNIFYFENSVNGEQSVNTLLAHEIAHQWFGNSASEIDWAHLWLSEGFATYMTNLYVELVVSEDEFRDLLNQQREAVIGFYKRSPLPVVNTKENNYMRLLNANSYQKGGWFLHMLRNKIGDDDFHETIKTYYDTYKLSNASTENFQDVAEKVSGQDLDSFFEQWLYKTGQPELKVTHKTNRKKTTVTVEQVQETGTIFEFPLEIKLTYADGSSEIKTVVVSKKKQNYDLEVASAPSSITLDPNVKLLFEDLN